MRKPQFFFIASKPALYMYIIYMGTFNSKCNIIFMHKCAKKCMCYLFHLLIYVEIITHEFDVGKKPFFLSNTCEEKFAEVLSKKSE